MKQEQQYIECAFHTDTAHRENVLDCLYAHDIFSVSIEDNSDLLDYTAGYPPELVDSALLDADRDAVVIRCYFEPDAFDLDLVKGIEAATGARLVLTDVKQEDWANNWKQYFKPKKIGQKLWIKPTWEEIHDFPAGDVVVEIDPGMAFGTGTHETTMLCLQALEEYLLGKGCPLLENAPEVLDIGCGSGILAIGALLLGAKRATGVDLDQEAVKTAMENAAVNGVDTKFVAQCGNLADKIQEKYDIILVNIVADAIIELTGNFSRLLKDGGIIIASGIIEVRYPEVKRAFEDAGFYIAQERLLKDWVCLVACSKNSV